MTRNEHDDEARAALALNEAAASAEEIRKRFQQLRPTSLAYTIMVCLAWSDDQGKQRREILLELVRIMSVRGISTLAAQEAM